MDTADVIQQKMNKMYGENAARLENQKTVEALKKQGQDLMMKK